MIEWLVSPLDLSRPHEVHGLIAWHGRLMVLAWGILVPVGILAARFFKIMPGQDWPRRLDNQAWWITHRWCHYLAAVASVVALGMILLEVRRVDIANLHALCGWSVMLLLAVQLLGGWGRGSKGGPTDGDMRGDHYDMTLRRRIFERVHKTAGYLAAAIAAMAIVTGLWRVNAPAGFWVLIVLWWMACLGAFVILQRRGLAVDTYQAIWGPDRGHPGSALAPIGWGISRRDGKGST